MKKNIINTSDSIINQYLKQLRSVAVQSDSMRFRHNITRISEMMAYEISKTLNYAPEQVQTPLGIAEVNIPHEKLVIATVFRAGLPMHTGFLNVFDSAESGFVSAFRKYIDNEHFEIHTEYLASPDLNGKTLILTDTMLATGSSMYVALQALFKNGKPNRVILASILGTQKAIDYLESQLGDSVELWIAAVDPKLNEHSYIVPGLGDAGDLAYGDKL